MSEIACPIWGTPATLLAGSRGAGMKVFSPRAGGRYRISSEALDDYPNLTDRQKAVLTTWMVDQRRFGEASPLITSEVLEEVLKGRPLRFSEKRERFFRSLLSLELKPGEAFPVFDAQQDKPVDMPRHPHGLLAAMGVESYAEGWAIICMIRDEGYLDVSSGYAALLSKGYEKLEELETGGANARQAFVAMWFGAEMNEAWRLGFAPGIRDAGYEPFRIDGKEHNNKIDDEIVAEIKRSRFLIADFTCGAERVKGKPVAVPRGGVYYEAGLAHGLGMEVIFSCRADRINDLHFDTRQFAHIVWNNPRELRDALYNRIAATVKEAPGAPGRGRGAVDPAPEPPKQPSVRLV